MEFIHRQEEFIFKEYQALLGDNIAVSPDGLHYLGVFTIPTVAGAEIVVMKKRNGISIVIENEG